MASRLPEEVVEEILLRVPPDDAAAHLVRATVVCKAWHSIISDDTFRRRYRRFHRTPPPLQGFFCNCFSDSTVQFVPTTSVAAASRICYAPMLDDGSDRNPRALDCRHGRLLIEVEADDNRRLIVWDPIAGSQQHVSLPTFLQNWRFYDYAGAVLCPTDGCDHQDCQGGPFHVVLVGSRFVHEHGAHVQTWASIYSSDTGFWSSPTTPNDKANQSIDETKRGLLIGDALYYTTAYGGFNIIKYDLRKHELSVIPLPVSVESILIEVNDGGLGVAARLCNSIYMWSWEVDNKGVGEWVNERHRELGDMLLSKSDLICMAEGTNIVFIGAQQTGVFTLDLRSGQVRKIGEPATYNYWFILPYMTFSTPKY